MYKDPNKDSSDKDRVKTTPKQESQEHQAVKNPEDKQNTGSIIKTNFLKFTRICI